MTAETPEPDALDELASIAGRSEAWDHIQPLVDQIRKGGLKDPGPPIVLVLTTTVDGNSSIRYLGDPEFAVQTLRSVADQVEKETII